MIIKASSNFTDKETNEKIIKGKEFSVTRKRGLELINKGFARLVSDDDYQSSDIAELNSLLHEKDMRIQDLQSILRERDQQISELTEQIPTPKRVKS